MSSDILETNEQSNNVIIPTETLNQKSYELINQIIPEDDIDTTKSIINLFNLNETKKNMLRLNKLNTIYDSITDQMITRLEKRSDNFSNDDLVKMMKVTQDAIDKSNQMVSGINDIPAIQINYNTHNNINNTLNLSSESRERITDAVNALLKTVDKNKELYYNNDEGIIEGDYSEGE